MAAIEAMIEITPTSIATSCGMRGLATATTTRIATIGLAKERSAQSRGGAQGGGVASLHRPVRGSRCPTPVLSPSGGLVKQPDINQAAARKVSINFMTGYPFF